MEGKKPLICIGLATFQRPIMLEKALLSLRSLSLPEGYKFKFIVCDNDPDKSALTIFQNHKDSIPFDSKYLTEPLKGIVHVRNAILKTALNEGGEYLAFFDDDEVVHPNWLSKLSECLEEYNAQAVAGSVVYLKESGKEVSFLKKKLRTSGEEMQSAATNNVLFSLSFCKRNNLNFNTAFNNSGGEDTFFFRQFVKAGGKIVHCSEAITCETVIEDRLDEEWLLARSFQDAYNSHIMKVLLYGNPIGLVLSLFHLLKLNIRYPFLSQNRKKKNRSKARGILRALSNKPYFAYDKIYGH